MSTFKNMNSLRTIEAQIVQKLENNEARPKFSGSYKKKRVLVGKFDQCKLRKMEEETCRCEEEYRKNNINSLREENAN